MSAICHIYENGNQKVSYIDNGTPMRLTAPLYGTYRSFTQIFKKYCNQFCKYYLWII